MSTTSLGQKHELRQMQSQVNVNQLRSVNLMQDEIETTVNFLDEIQNVLHMKQKYLIVQKEVRMVEMEKAEGQIYKKIKDGFGAFIFKNGDKYIGFWHNDLMQGMGVYFFKPIEFQAEIVYMGEFAHGKFNGMGKLIRLLGDNKGDIIYRGNWNEGLKSENGIHYYQNQTCYYKGSWENDLKSGRGVFVSPEGQFDGLWSQNKKNGEGRLKRQNGKSQTVYSGVWLNDDLQKGFIRYYDANNLEIGNYEGAIDHGKKHGNGTYTWLNELKGMIYEGSFSNDLLTGWGTLKTKEYSITGNFTSNGDLNVSMEVTGTITYSNKDVFRGSFLIEKNTLRRSKGQYQFGNGDAAKGQFEDIGSELNGNYDYFWKNGYQKHFNNFLR